MREYRENQRWNRCDHCGKFISMKDLNSGTAMRRMVYPDTAFTAETYETLCAKHNDRKKKRNERS